MLKRKTRGAFAQLTRALAGLLVLYGFSGGSSFAGAPSPDAQDVVPSGAVGELRYLGSYPGGDGNSTITALPDGRLLLYGVRMDVDVPETGKTLRLRNRREHGLAGHVFAEPRLWDPKRRGWIKVERPPECRSNSMLATATALADGKVLIAGGLCDLPRLADDRSPNVPYTHLSLWDSADAKWLAAPSLATSRIFHAANLLRDDSVLIVGGESDPEDVPVGVEPVLNAVESYRDGRVEQLSPLHEARARHTATLLNNGSLLVVGGFDANGKAIASAEIWDPALKVWLDAPPLKIARYGHSATLLDDGRVMIAGGIGAHGQAIGSVEIRDPATGAWSPGRPLLLPLYGHAATLLTDGDVLIAGGSTLHTEPVRETMLWNKASREWLPAGIRVPQATENNPQAVSTLPLADGGALLFGKSWILHWRRSDAGPRSYPAYGKRLRSAVTATADGRVLISGGAVGNAFLDRAEVYDPVTGLFSLTGRMHQARHSHAGLALDDGAVVVAGGWVRSPDEPGRPLANSPEVWNPSTGAWSVIRDIRFAWQDWVHLGKLNNGSVLFFASRELSEEHEPSGPVEYRAWLWNPGTGRVEAKHVPIKPRARAAIAIRPDGTVLVAGGATRILQPEYRCPEGERKADVDSDGDSCRDEPARWAEYGERSVELWDSRTGALSQLAPLPERRTLDPKTLVLKNGDVVVANYAPPNPHRGVHKLPVLLWRASTGRWSDLPPLDARDSVSLLELADGSLLSRSMRLPLGGASWSDSGAIQSDDARPVMLPSGKVVAIATQPPYVSTYDPMRAGWDYLVPGDSAPMWRSQPALTSMPDGRLMAVATVESGSAPVQSAYIWNPASDTWTAAGRLARRYGKGQAVSLRSGNVLHLGVFNETDFVCELWRPEDDSWTFCGTLIRGRGERGGPVLGKLADGSPAVISGVNEAMVFREPSNAWARMKLEINRESLTYGVPIRPRQKFYARVFDESSGQWIDASALAAMQWQKNPGNPPNTLWDEEKHEWAYVLPRGKGLGSDPMFLPDGCALSLSPARLFNPHTGAVTPLDNPGLGPEFFGAGVAVLDNGTVVAASSQYGAPGGTGFFQRKASCAGFATQADDALLMPPTYAAAVTAQAPAAEYKPPEKWREQALRLAHENRWIMLAVLGPAAAYLLIRFIGLPLFGALWRRIRRAPVEKNSAHRWSAGFRWTMRAILYLIAAAIALPLALNLFLFKISESSRECADRPSACLNSETGILRKIPSLDTGKADGSAEPRIPCRYVGIWSSIQRGKVLRITLSEDGRYVMAPNALVGGAGYTGYWAVQGHNMIWRHNQRNTGEPDINPISKESDTQFTLTEKNGSRTRFELIESIRSVKCVP